VQKAEHLVTDSPERKGYRYKMNGKKWGVADKPVATLSFADSLRERQDLVARPAVIPTTRGRDGTKAVAFCGRGKTLHFILLGTFNELTRVKRRFITPAEDAAARCPACPVEFRRTI